MGEYCFFIHRLRLAAGFFCRVHFTYRPTYAVQREVFISPLSRQLFWMCQENRLTCLLTVECSHQKHRSLLQAGLTIRNLAVHYICRQRDVCLVQMSLSHRGTRRRWRVCIRQSRFALRILFSYFESARIRESKENQIQTEYLMPTASLLSATRSHKHNAVAATSVERASPNLCSTTGMSLAVRSAIVSRLMSHTCNWLLSMVQQHRVSRASMDANQMAQHKE